MLLKGINSAPNFTWQPETIVPVRHDIVPLLIGMDEEHLSNIPFTNWKELISWTAFSTSGVFYCINVAPALQSVGQASGDWTSNSDLGHSNLLSLRIRHCLFRQPQPVLKNFIAKACVSCPVKNPTETKQHEQPEQPA